MKVALVIERMDTHRGGREASTSQIATDLVARGHEVTILCQSGSFSAEGVTVRELPRPWALRHTRLKQFVADVQCVMVEEDFDIVHAMLPIPGANVYQPRGGTIPGQRHASIRRRGPLLRPIVAALGDFNFRRGVMAKLEKQVMADPAVACLAVSEMISREFRDYYDRTENVHVIYNGVDIPEVSGEQRADWRQELRFKLNLKQQDIVFLCVAKNFDLKGVPEAILGFARWLHERPDSQRDARLVVVGQTYAESYQRLAGANDIGGKVFFVPHEDNISRWYAAADVCVLLSWYDPCSRVVLEATRWGIPSITTIFNGAAEMLSGGGGVVVASPKEFRAVAKAMGELAAPEHRAAAEDACKTIAPQLSMTRHVDGLVAVYERIAAGRMY